MTSKLIIPSQVKETCQRSEIANMHNEAAVIELSNLSFSTVSCSLGFAFSAYAITKTGINCNYAIIIAASSGLLLCAVDSYRQIKRQLSRNGDNKLHI